MREKNFILKFRSIKEVLKEIQVHFIRSYIHLSFRIDLIEFFRLRLINHKTIFLILVNHFRRNLTFPSKINGVDPLTRQPRIVEEMQAEKVLKHSP